VHLHAKLEAEKERRQRLEQNLQLCQSTTFLWSPLPDKKIWRTLNQTVPEADKPKGRAESENNNDV
jgi:hypothetical protein